MTLLGDRGIKLHGAPPPQRLLLQLRFTTPQGIKQISFHRLDFFISFLRFFNPPRGWGKEESMLKSSREAIETNRCFFIHLGIAINVHPFALQVRCQPYLSHCINDLFHCVTGLFQACSSHNND